MFEACELPPTCGEPKDGVDCSAQKSCLRPDRALGGCDMVDDADVFEPSHILDLFAEAGRYSSPEHVATPLDSDSLPTHLALSPASRKTPPCSPRNLSPMTSPMHARGGKQPASIGTRASCCRCSCPPRMKSSPKTRIDTDMVLDRSWWCSYCLCGGLGCSSVPALTNIICKSVCCITSCEAIPCCGEALCTCITGCCCCNLVGEMIPKQGTPCLICCGYDFYDCCCTHPHWPGGESLNHVEKRDPYSYSETLVRSDSYEMILWDSFMLWFCCCCGCSTQKQCRCARNAITCGCCHCQSSLNTPRALEEVGAIDGCCALLWSCWCLRAQCWLPPRVHANPICAMCGWRGRKAKVRACGWRPDVSPSLKSKRELESNVPIQSERSAVRHAERPSLALTDAERFNSGDLTWH